MRRFFCNGLVRLLCVGLFTTVLLTGCDRKKNTEHTGSMFAMDTYMTFTVYGENGEESIAMAKQEIQRLDRMLSTGDENSEVSMLNRDGEGVLSKDLEVLWENSLKLYEMTDGSFDVTIYPVMRAWGFAGDNFGFRENRSLGNCWKGWTVQGYPGMRKRICLCYPWERNLILAELQKDTQGTD